MNEIWRPTHVEHYEVSNFGRVRSMGHLSPRVSKKRRYFLVEWPGRILAQKTSNSGYQETNLNGEMVIVHRLVATAFVPRHHDGLEVHHIDGDKQNNFAGNLEWVTHAANMARDTPKQRAYRERNKRQSV